MSEGTHLPSYFPAHSPARPCFLFTHSSELGSCTVQQPSWAATSKETQGLIQTKLSTAVCGSRVENQLGLQLGERKMLAFLTYNTDVRTSPGGPSCWDSAFPMQEGLVQSLVGKLNHMLQPGVHMPWSKDPRTTTKKDLTRCKKIKDPTYCY